MAAWLGADPAQAEVPELRFRLPGGLSLVVDPREAGPAQVSLSWPEGHGQDPPGHAGLHAAQAEALWEGSGLKATAKELGWVGGWSLGPDHGQWAAQGPAGGLVALLQALGRTLASAPQGEGAWAPNASWAQVGAQQLAWRRVPGAALRAEAWGLSHGLAWGRGPWGQVPQLAPDPATWRRHLVRTWAPNHLALCISGPVRPEALVGEVVRAMSPTLPWPSPAPAGVEAPEGAPSAGQSSPHHALLTWKTPGWSQGPQEAIALSLAARVLHHRLALWDLGARWWVCRHQVARAGGVFVVASEVPTLEATASATERLAASVIRLREIPVGLDEWAAAQGEEVAGIQADLEAPGGRARVLGLGLVLAQRPGWDQAWPALVRQVSRAAMQAAIERHLGPGGQGFRRSGQGPQAHPSGSS